MTYTNKDLYYDKLELLLKVAIFDKGANPADMSDLWKKSGLGQTSTFSDLNKQVILNVLSRRVFIKFSDVVSKPSIIYPGIPCAFKLRINAAYNKLIPNKYSVV